MLYLACTIHLSLGVVAAIIHSDKVDVDIWLTIKFILYSILWSIWYMYFLH